MLSLYLINKDTLFGSAMIFLQNYDTICNFVNLPSSWPETWKQAMPKRRSPNNVAFATMVRFWCRKSSSSVW